MLRWRLVNVVERQGVPMAFCCRDNAPCHVRRDFLPPLLIVRHVALRNADGLAEGGLRQAKPLADLVDIVHGRILVPLFHNVKGSPEKKYQHMY